MPLPPGAGTLVQVRRDSQRAGGGVTTTTQLDRWIAGFFEREFDCENFVVGEEFKETGVFDFYPPVGHFVNLEGFDVEGGWDDVGNIAKAKHAENGVAKGDGECVGRYTLSAFADRFETRVDLI